MATGTARDVHPAIEALLQWRKAERIATTLDTAGWTAVCVRTGYAASRPAVMALQDG